MGGQSLGEKNCAESDFEVRFAKFQHLAITQNGTRRVSGKKKGSGKSGSRESVKIKKKGVDKKHWPQFGHIDADFKNSKKRARLICFHLRIKRGPNFNKL